MIDVEMVQQAQKLAPMKEYMLASLLPGKFVSFKVLDQGDDVASCFAQMILVEPKVTCVEMCTQEGNDLTFRVAVQEFTPVLPVAADHASLSHAKSIEVFCFSDEDPHDIDFGQLEPSSREDLLQWSARPSDCGISSHTTLHDPQALRPNASLSLLDRGMPTLCLLDWLSEAGWVGQSRLITHTPDLPKVFDDRTPLAHKDYLRCAIVIDDLYAAGVAELRSGRPTTYYRFTSRSFLMPTLAWLRCRSVWLTTTTRILLSMPCQNFQILWCLRLWQMKVSLCFHQATMSLVHHRLCLLCLLLGRLFLLRLLRRAMLL